MNIKTGYLTIKDESETRLEIERSVFIARIARAETGEEAAGIINRIKLLEREATHNCSAYVIGGDSGLQKTDDDGEPSGTAGRPILEAIKRSGLTDCVIVVTRYYGGIKLGAGGLIRAYSSAAKGVIDAAGVVERVLYTIFRFEADYSLLKSIETVFERSGFIITGRVYSDRVTIETAVKVGDEEKFRDILSEITSGSVLPEEIKKVYIDHQL